MMKSDSADQLRSALKTAAPRTLEAGETGRALRTRTGDEQRVGRMVPTFTRTGGGGLMAIAVCITTPAAKDDPAGDAKPAVSVAKQMSRAAAESHFQDRLTSVVGNEPSTVPPRARLLRAKDTALNRHSSPGRPSRCLRSDTSCAFMAVADLSRDRGERGTLSGFGSRCRGRKSTCPRGQSPPPQPPPPPPPPPKSSCRPKSPPAPSWRRPLEPLDDEESGMEFHRNRRSQNAPTASQNHPIGVDSVTSTRKPKKSSTSWSPTAPPP